MPCDTTCRTASTGSSRLLFCFCANNGKYFAKFSSYLVSKPIVKLTNPKAPAVDLAYIMLCPSIRGESAKYLVNNFRQII